MTTTTTNGALRPGGRQYGLRGTVPGLPSPLPLAGSLPSMLRDDRFAVGLCDGLDEVLAPILLTLDSFPAYLDVHTAPDDMLGWLAQWVGVIASDTDAITAADAERLRRLLTEGQQLHVRRGTRLGIERAVAAELGLSCEVIESGAAAWSDQPGRPLPDGDLAGSAPAISVIVHPKPGQEVDRDRLDAVLAAATPAHVRRQVTVRG